MYLLAGVRIALRALRINKLRSALTMLGIVIGVGAVIAMVAVGAGIKAVAQKIVDGAAVDSLIWEYENRTKPEFTSATKIVEKSPPYGIPPVVVRKGLDPQLKDRVRQVFLNAHQDEQGSSILQGMMIDKFGPIDDSAYDSIRDMQNWIAAKRKRKGK